MSSNLIPASSREVLTQKFKIVLLTSVLSVALLITSAGATLESDVSAIKSDVNTMDTNISRIYTVLNTYISDIYSRLGTISTHLSSISNSIGSGLGSNVSSINSDTSVIRSNSAGINTIVTQLGASGTIGQKVSSSNTYLGLIQNQTDGLEGYAGNIDWNLARIAGFLVNSHHVALESASEDSVDEATSMYQSTPNGNTTAQNNAAISGFSSDISSSFNTGVSSGDVFSYMNSGDPGYDPSLPIPDQRDRGIFAFFSNDTMFDLDPSLNTRSSQPQVVDYLSFNQRSIESHINGGSNR